MSEEAPLPTNLPDEASTPKKPKRLFLGWTWKTLLFLLLLLGALQFIFRKYSDQIFGRLLREAVALQSDGLYALQYDAIYFDLINLKLHVEKLRLLPNKADFFNDTLGVWRTKNAVYEANIPKMVVNAGSLVRMIRQEAMLFEHIELESPTVKVFLHSEGKATAPAGPKQFKLLGGYAQYLFVDDLHIKNGTLEAYHAHEAAPQAVRGMSVTAIGFLIDSATVVRDGRPFTVEDINVEAGPNSFLLQNSPYTLSFERMEFSTYGTFFKLSEFRLAHTEAHRKRIAKQQERTGIELYVPSLQFFGLDFRKAYMQQELQALNLEVMRPEFRLYKAASMKPAPAGQLYSKIARLFKRISVKNVEIVDGELGIVDLHSNRNSKRLQVASISGKVGAVLIDSATHLQREPFFFIDHAALDLEGVQQPLGRSGHWLSARKVALSTQAQTLTARHVRVRPGTSAEKKLEADSLASFEHATLDLPFVQMKGVHIRRAYLDRNFQIGNCYVKEPNIQLQLHKPDTGLQQAPDSLPMLKDLYPFFKGFASNMEIERLDVEKGKLSIKQERGLQTAVYEADSLGLYVRNMRAGPKWKNRPNDFFNAEDLGLGLQSFRIQTPDSLYRIWVGNMRLSRPDSAIFLEDVVVRPQLDIARAMPDSLRPKAMLQLALRHFEVDSIDLASIYYKGHAHIERIWLDKPEAEWILLDKNMPAPTEANTDSLVQGLFRHQFKDLRVEHIQLDSGHIKITDGFNRFRKLEAQQLDLHAQGFFADSSTLTNKTVRFRLDTMATRIQAFFWRLPDSVHDLRVGELWLDTELRRVRLRRARLNARMDLPNIASIPAVAEGELPELAVEGIDLKKLYYEQELIAESIHLLKPKIYVRLHDLDSLPRKGLPNLDSLYWLAVHPLQLLKAGKLAIDSGRVALLHEQYGGKTQHHQASLSAWADSIHLDPFVAMRPRNFLYSTDIGIHVWNYAGVLPDSSYWVRLQDFRTSTKSKALEVKGLQLLPDSAKPEYVRMQAPHLAAQGYDLNRWYRNGTLALDSLQALGVALTRMNAYDSAQVPIAEALANIPQLIKPVADTLQISTVDVGDMGIEWWLKPAPDSAVLLRLPHLFASLRKLNLYKGAPPLAPDSLLFCHDIQAQMRDYRLALPDSLRVFEAEALGFHSKKKHLYMLKPSLAPTDSLADYLKHFGYDTDWLAAGAKRADLYDLDIPALLIDGDFDANKLVIEHLDAKVQRNSSMPDNPAPSLAKLPRHILNSLGFRLVLDTMVLKDGKFSYWEYNNESPRPGYLKINNINATVRNITNDKKLIKDWQSVAINLSLRLMNTGNLNMVFDLPLDDDKGNYYYEGVLDSMDLKEMNPLLENTAFLKIRNGTAKKIRFKVSGNDEYATGIMRFYYKNLRVTVLNPKKNSDEKFVSFIANAFVVHKSNPRRLFFLRKGKMFYRRNPHSSIFSYWTNTLLTGVKASIGLGRDEKPDKVVKRTVLEAIADRFKAEKIKERKEERDRMKILKQRLQEQRKGRKASASAASYTQ